jgi:hypothetical protein|tara:strand:+ start:1525 stop:1932 length:408 start_codon:yes stop_codon:yes gene_type:complete
MKTISKLKKELDKWFSLYIRLRDATDEGLVQCFTCNKVSHYKSGMQNGHFQSRKHLATRWDEENCQVQCVGCNMFKAGEQYKFSIALDSKYGEGTSEELERIARKTVKCSSWWYEEEVSYYKELVEKLKKEKGIE